MNSIPEALDLVLSTEKEVGVEGGVGAKEHCIVQEPERIVITFNKYLLPVISAIKKSLYMKGTSG